MTREEAKEIFLNRGFIDGIYDGNKWREAYIVISEWLKEEPKTWSLDDAREDFTSDVYNTLDFLPTNNEANRIIDSFDRVTSNIKQEPILDKINKMKSEIADSLEFWDYSPNNNPLARDMLETITNFWGNMRGEGK